VSEVLRRHAEQQYAEELGALLDSDDRPRPPGWKLSPWAVKTYLLGGTLPDGFAIAPKYIGNGRLIEIAIATLATDRALLLLRMHGLAHSREAAFRTLQAAWDPFVTKMDPGGKQRCTNAPGQLTPRIDRTYPLSEGAEAIRYVGTGQARAKVVITF